jgi:GT2 family glycosyltransferase
MEPPTSAIPPPSPTLSILIVNWNGLRVLRRCLVSIQQTANDIDHEIIVVDNHSSDASTTMVRDSFPNVILIENPANSGFAAANNIAIAASRGRWVLLLNNDTELHPGCLQTALDYLQSHPETGALGARAVFPDGSHQTTCYRFNTPWILFLTRFLPLASSFHERLNHGRYHARQFKSPTHVDCVAGCFLMLSRDLIDRIGPLDEDFFMYGEDEVWCHRIHQAGKFVTYHPDCVITHYHRQSSAKSPRQLNDWEFFHPVLVVHKTLGPRSASLANAILTAGSLLRLPFWLYHDLIHSSRLLDLATLIRKRSKILLKQLSWARPQTGRDRPPGGP